MGDDDSVRERDNEEYKSGYDTEQGEAEVEKKKKKRKKFKIKTPSPTVPHLEIEVDKNFGNTKVITGSQCTICQLCVENRCIHLIILKIYLYMHILFCTAAKHLFGIKMCTPVSILCL